MILFWEPPAIDVVNVFSSNDDGRDFGGERCTDGICFCSYTATADNGETFSGQGTITLVDSGLRQVEFFDC